MRKAVTYSFCIIASILFHSQVNAQTGYFRPQLWSNFSPVWQISEKVSIRSNIGFNYLLSDDMPWNELTAMASGNYHFHRFMEADIALYFARVKQDKNLSSFEYRPSLGYRIFSNPVKRWLVVNSSRIEARFFRYSDRTTNLSFRFRNRTNAAVSLTRHSMADNGNLFLFGYFELFYNFGMEVRERFFNQFKYKLGLGYRLNDAWRFNMGVIYQDAVDNVIEPTQIPVEIDTRYIFEWGIIYVIPLRQD